MTANEVSKNELWLRKNMNLQFTQTKQLWKSRKENPQKPTQLSSGNCFENSIMKCLSDKILNGSCFVSLETHIMHINMTILYCVNKT